MTVVLALLLIIFGVFFTFASSFQTVSFDRVLSYDIMIFSGGALLVYRSLKLREPASTYDVLAFVGGWSSFVAASRLLLPSNTALRHTCLYLSILIAISAGVISLKRSKQKNAAGFALVWSGLILTFISASVHILELAIEFFNIHT